MDNKRFKCRVGVSLVLIEKDEVLLLRRYNTGLADGRHVLPMGGVEKGESATQTMVREAKEEINLTLNPETLHVAHTMHRLHHLPNGDAFEQIDLFYIPQSYEGTIENREPYKCDELKFYPFIAFPNTLEPFVKQALQCIRSGISYSEFGWSQNLDKSFSSNHIKLVRSGTRK